MKLLCILAVLFLFACATPNRDIIVITPYGPIMIEKGFLDDTGNYYTIPEWNAFIKQTQQNMQDKMQDKKKFF